MTPGERRDPAIIDGSRRLRIANGSGATTSEVNQLLRQFSEVQRMMKRFGIGGGGKRKKKKGRKSKGSGRTTPAGTVAGPKPGSTRPELKLPGLN
jgi:signal recognition particle subunit SRP54